jgi:DNA-binding NarL/FixJ family response regulator
MSWPDLAPDPTPQGVCRSPQLSTRQIEVLEHLAAGATTREIATALFLSPQAVSYHITHMLTFFRVRTRTGLVARAYSLGLLQTGRWPPCVVSALQRQ